MGGYFSFRKMVSTAIIKILYFLGMLTLTIGGIALMVTGRDEEKLYGVGALVLGNIVWRILCEGFILSFSIHDIVGSIERRQKTSS